MHSESVHITNGNIYHHVTISGSVSISQSNFIAYHRLHFKVILEHKWTFLNIILMTNGF
jgi:hypothetical protein